MKRQTHIPGAVLPTVMVASTLLVLLVLAVIALWEADFIYFSRHRYNAALRSYIASGFTLYAEYPDRVVARLDADSTLLLYDSLPHSRIGINSRPLGLYEVVTVSSHDGGMRVSNIFGRRTLHSDDFVLYCSDRGSSLILTGKTNIEGFVRIPAAGLTYGQMGADFFSGAEIPPAMMIAGGSELPPPCVEALAIVGKMMEFATEDVIIDGSQVLSDTVIVARRVHIDEGFSGSLQIFALDSITVAGSVTLDYPSGLLSERHVSIGEGSVVNGYVIVTPTDASDIMHANYIQSRRAKVRGLVYVDGIAQIQGIVSGVAMIDRAIYYSPRGYYENMFYDFTLLKNHLMAWPLWLEGADQRRKEIKWLD